MNRCRSLCCRATFFIAGGVLAAWTLALFPSESRAQQPDAVRQFPKAALRGELVVVSPPDVRLDGRADRLSPGSRIRDPQNLLVMSGALIGRELTVNYVRDSAGLIHEVWILNATEARERRAGATASRNFLFGSEVDTTPRDDGKTPFDQLPRYGQPAAPQ